MKKTVVIGATGFVGTAILKEALSREIQVTAISRDPSKIALNHPLLKREKVDVAHEEIIESLFKGHDHVISAYNPGWHEPNIYEKTLKIYPAILNAAKRAGVKRFLCVGGAGVLFVSPGIRLIETGTIPEAIMPAAKSLGEFYLNILQKEEAIDWVFFSPAVELVTAERTGKFRLGNDEVVINKNNGRSQISVEDYAVAMIDELEHPQHHKECFTIGY